MLYFVVLKYQNGFRCANCERKRESLVLLYMSYIVCCGGSLCGMYTSCNIEVNLFQHAL